ncbi:MAG: hypothetical protein K2Q14_01835 [Gammaproteobacteria bacterium]|nr:hypothetical protein [Gammaproteobacteria bacterium]
MRDSNDYFIYIDESGNTCGDLFNLEQQYFVYAYLCTSIDIDKAKVDELRLSKLRHFKHAESVFKMLENMEMANFYFYFYFLIVEKKYFATCLLFDEIFDSGINKRISNNDYFNLINRHLLLAGFYESIKSDNFEKLKELYLTLDKNKGEFKTVFLNYINYLIKHTNNNKIRSALIYVLDYPEKFLSFKEDVLLNPQLMLYYAGFEMLVEDKSIKNALLHIKHDQNYHAETSLNKNFSSLTKDLAIQQGYDYRTGMMTLTELQNNIKIEHQFVENSIGVAITDFFAWLVFQKFNNIKKTDKLSSIFVKLDKYAKYNVLDINYIYAQLIDRIKKKNNH